MGGSGLARSMCDLPEEELAEYLAWHEPVRVVAPPVRTRTGDSEPTEAERPSPVDEPLVPAG